jgi:predicted nucleic acid-binding protein
VVFKAHGRTVGGPTIRNPFVAGAHYHVVLELVLDDIENVLDPALPLTAQTSRAALAFAREHGLAFYDALIVASSHRVRLRHAVQRETCSTAAPSAG